MISSLRRLALLAATAAACSASACDRPEPRQPPAAGGDTVQTSPQGGDTAVPERPEPADQLRTALRLLLRGPQPPAPAGQADTWFSAATADALRSVSVDAAGHATVDFIDLRPLIPNASSSAGSELLLSELNATVFQFPAVRSVEYRMEGSCAVFWEWLQYGCHTVTREELPLPPL